MAVRKSVLNMAAYAVIMVLILFMGLSLLKARGAVKANEGMLASLGVQNKAALDKVDEQIEEVVSAKIGQLNRSMEEKLSQLRTQDIKQQQAVSELQRKLDASAGQGDELKWVVNPATRRRYALIPFALPWHAAKAYAEAKGGHLVVINDKEENEWVVRTFGGDTEYWTGVTDEAEEGKWRAVSGEQVEYFNWAPGEPDNYRKSQHYVMINSKAPHLNQTDAGRWNDVAANDSRIGIIERAM